RGAVPRSTMLRPTRVRPVTRLAARKHAMPIAINAKMMRNEVSAVMRPWYRLRRRAQWHEPAPSIGERHEMVWPEGRAGDRAAASVCGLAARLCGGALAALLRGAGPRSLSRQSGGAALRAAGGGKLRRGAVPRQR